ncbi:MAG: hypothetical protein ABSC08_17120 [Bryobacteraceae bacterium]
MNAPKRLQLLAAVLLTATAGTTRAASKLNVSTATEDLAGISREIGGDKINVDSLEDSGRGARLSRSLAVLPDPRDSDRPDHPRDG